MQQSKHLCLLHKHTLQLQRPKKAGYRVSHIVHAQCLAACAVSSIIQVADHKLRQQYATDNQAISAGHNSPLEVPLLQPGCRCVGPFGSFLQAGVGRQLLLLLLNRW
jgi:hypothetical protein